MKKLFLLLFALLAMSANVSATSVSIASNQVPNFSPSNLSPDVPLTVSVTNGSATVTGTFRANWVGLGGFTLTINSVDYFVANVASTSSLTLTTNYAGTTNAAESAILRKYVELRIYVDPGSGPFQPLGNCAGSSNPCVVQTGAPGSGAWYRRYAVSILNVNGTNIAYIPAITIDATTDSPTNQLARYIAGWYRPGGADGTGASFIAFYDCFSQFFVRPTTPATWVMICQYNSAQNVARDQNSYTIGQIDSRFPPCTAGQSYYFASTGNILS